MDFEDSPEEAAFRKEVRTWLDANAKKREGKREIDPDDMENGAANEMAASKALRKQKVKAKAGYARITLAQGRRAASVARRCNRSSSAKWGRSQVRRRRRRPVRDRPLRHVHPGAGDGVWRRRRRQEGARSQPAVQGDEIWCQLFSEPAGGSDVANLRTKAEKNADGTWTINGSKIWTTGAQFSDFPASSSPAPTPMCPSTRA